MNPLAILATVDAAITAYERALELLDEARKRGIITPEEQAKRLQDVNDIRARVGLPSEPGNSPG